MKNISSSDLFARPSFIEGIARIVDLGGNLQEYNVSETEAEADENAIGNDWRIVGQDLSNSFKRYERGSTK